MNKINIFFVAVKHYKTLSDQRGRLLMPDLFMHILFPILLSFSVCFFYGGIKQSIASVFVNFGAITTALLMTAVIMIFDQKQKTQSKIKESMQSGTNANELVALNNNKVVYEQLCRNISYTILTSVFLVISSVVVSFFPDNLAGSNNLLHSFFYYFLSFVGYVSFSATVITFLMVIKRFSSILDH